jgi:NDP-sugar pyrophosphorylase family protein
MDYAIIAAGAGSRLIADGISSPKPLVRTSGETLVDRLLRIFITNSATSISIIINEEMEEVNTHLRTLHLPVPLRITVKSTPSSMHSLHELSRTLPAGADRFCVTTVDTIFREEDFARYITAFRTEEADALMAVTEYIDDESPLYVNVAPDGTIRSFDDHPGARHASGGIYGLRRSALPVLQRAIEEGRHRMRNFQRSLISEGLRIKAFPFGKIIDLDHASDIAKAKELLNN